MSFFTSRNNTRAVQPNRRLVPPPMRRPMPRPQMSRPIQPVRPPTGLPQQISAPTGLPNQMLPPLGMPNQIQQPTGLPNIMQPPLGLPNINQQPTGLPPTQTQLPTPPVTMPVEQSPSLFAPPVQQPIQQQPAIAPVFQPPQTAGPVAPQPEMPMMQQPVDRPVDMQQPAQQNQRDPQYIGMPDEMYARMIKDKQMNNGQGPMDMSVRDWQQWSSNQSQQPVAGPIEPDWKYNSDNTMRSISGMGTGLAEGVPYKQSQQYDPITGKWGMPGGEGGKFMEGISIGW